MDPTGPEEKSDLGVTDLTPKKTMSGNKRSMKIYPAPKRMLVAQIAEY